MWLEVRPLGRAHTSLPEAHGPQTLPVSEVRPRLLSVGPPGPAHEETPLRGAIWKGMDPEDDDNGVMGGGGGAGGDGDGGGGRQTPKRTKQNPKI